MAGYNSIYNNVYNYYRTSFYTPKSNSRFDSHKRSELKDVYNSIINQSKEEPVYLIKRTSEIERYTIDMKESAMSFARDIASYSGSDTENLFEKKSVHSSNPDVATADYYDDLLQTDDEIEPVSLTVEALARPQTNRGYYLEPDNLNISTGSYSFDVNTSQSSYELQFSVGDNDTNRTIQTRLARLINNSGIGLNASVSTNNVGDTALVISSQSNGLGDGQPTFEISDEDTSQKSGIIDYLGIRNITEEASWAKYTVDGNSYSSPDNNVNLAGRFAATLTGTTDASDAPVIISTKPDYDSLKDTINGVARSYNNFIKTVSEYLDKQPRTSLLADSMKRMTGYYQDTFDKLGIGREADGTLSVNDTTLSNTIKNMEDDSLVSSMKDFTKSALRKVNQVSLNPMDYVDKRIVAYKDPNKTHYANPYVTSAYSGLLFNSYM